MKRVTVTKISVGSLAKVFGVAHAVIAFVIGLIATISVASGAIRSDSSFIQTLGISLLWLGWGVIIYPIVAFFLGWIEGAVAALILNFIFLESGGISVHTEEEPATRGSR